MLRIRTTLQARLVIDASGSRTPHIRRPDQGPVAGQAAYGVVGRFSKPPIEPSRFVLMDYRCDHLSEEQRSEPPIFVCDGSGRWGVLRGRASLALAPGVPYDVLKQRPQQRLDLRGVEITEVIHEEFCLFPMNLPLPDRNQPVLAFGGRGEHGASGLGLHGGIAAAAGSGSGPGHRRSHRQSKPWISSLGATGLASALADRIGAAPSALSIRFGPLMGFNEALLRTHFATFFSLPREEWFGFLTNTLPLPRLMGVMLRLFALSPWELRRGLVLGAAQDQAPRF